MQTISNTPKNVKKRGDFMEIERKIGFFATANYRVLDYDLRQTNDLYIICCGEEHFDSPKVIGPYTEMAGIFTLSPREAAIWQLTEQPRALPEDRFFCSSRESSLPTGPIKIHPGLTPGFNLTV